MRPCNAALLALAVAAFAALPAATQAATGATAPCAASAGAELATSASYRFVLHVGMAEKMYTPAQVRTMHPKTGEVMLGGAMTMSGMTMGSGNATRHLELQICSRATGKLLTDAKPAITLSDSMGMATHVQTAMMRGVEAGTADMHYGNNVTMPAGRKLTVKVVLNGEAVTFTVRSPMAR